MKRFLTNLIGSMPLGPRLLIIIYALTLPLALISLVPGLQPLASILDFATLNPNAIWHGQVWRLITYALMPAGIMDWAISLFWLITLVNVVGRNFSSVGFWGYCSLCAAAGALPFVFLMPKADVPVATCAAIIFGLLVAWERLYRHERIILLGFGEVSVRAAAIVVGLINVLVIFFCVGWLLTLSLLCGGLAGWLFFLATHRSVLSRRSRVVESDRMARLEL